MSSTPVQTPLPRIWTGRGRGATTFAGVLSIFVAGTSVLVPRQADAALQVGANSPSTGGAPGGYWGLAERRPPEPKDGDEELIMGGVLLSLGVLRAGAGLTTFLAGRPDHCKYDLKSCENVRYYGYAGLGFGGLMLGTGIVFLILGQARRERHRRWKLDGSLAVLGEGGRSGSVSFRFDF